MKAVALLLSCAVAAVAVVELGARDRSVGNCSARARPRHGAASPLPPTQLAALPGRADRQRHRAAGGDAVGARLRRPRRRQRSSPKVAGSWSAVGDSEVFTPVSTLQPCSTYALTVWARTSATGHIAARAPTHDRACTSRARRSPALQQALARLGYLGAKLRPRYTVHIPPGPRRAAKPPIHAFHPPRGALAPDPSDAPPVELGQLDATTRGALEVYQADRGLEATGEPNSATWASLLYDETHYRRDPCPIHG